MFIIDYIHTDYAKLLNELAEEMDVKLKNEKLEIPVKIAKGYFKYIPLANGLQCMLSNYTLNQDICLKRKQSKKEFYVLRIDEILIANKLIVKIDNEEIIETNQNRASVFLTSSKYDFEYQASKDTSIKCINVLIPRKWLEQYLDITTMDVVLNNYFNLKTQCFNLTPFDIEYRTLFNEIMDDGDVIMKRPILENRIMMMVEKFLTYVYQKMSCGEADSKIKISQDEIKRLMEVESYLVKDFSTPPPPISFLSRVAAMSTTTLKNKFKKLYGNNLYEYFQKSRMHKAKVLLLTQKYSIKEIGSQLGYANLSNFATAFKKEFNRLPSQLIVQR